MPFTGIWVGEGGGTFQGESSTEAQMMTYITQTSQTTSSILSAINTMETWLNAWKMASDVAQSNLDLHLTEHEAHLQTLDDWIRTAIRDLNAKLDTLDDRNRQRFEQLTSSVQAAQASIEAYLGQEVDNLESRLASIQTDLTTVKRVLDDTYERSGTINENLVQHDRNIVGRTQQIYDKEAEIQQALSRVQGQLVELHDKSVYECQRKLRQMPQLLSVYGQMVLSPLFADSKPSGETWQTTISVNGAPQPTQQEGVYNYDYQITGQVANGLDTSRTNDVVTSRLRALDAYGKFKPVSGDIDLYFSEQLPAVLTWPFRIAGDGGRNLF